MSLAPGHKLAHYEILEPIGKGGMGEVYRGHDNKLGRDVAIKVLPEEFARDKERLDRFEREARLLAQLNHANVATLHGLEESNGQRFLVMELVEGETLAERLPLPLDEAIPIFVHIAEGLEAAHEKGIIHRDLKPANIKIGLDGEPKILDFGLAKAFAGDESAPDSSQSPTLTKGTALGAIMGTASYMSPEQARGKLVDKRTDIWAFGCCLFETLTGNKVFDGESVTDILAEVVKNQPDFSRLPAKTPLAVKSTLKRCLEKNARQRLHHIADVRLGLESGDAESVDSIPSPGWLARSVVLVGVAAVVTTLAVSTLWTTRPPYDKQPHRREISFPPSQILAYDQPPSLSPDGRRIAYSAAEDGTPRLYVRELDQLEPRALPETEGARMAIFSPDGEEIAFHRLHNQISGHGTIFRVGVAGGPPVEVAPATDTWWAGMDWGEDDTVVFSEAFGLSRTSADGREQESLTEVDASAGERFHLDPHFVPGEDTIFFSVVFGNGDVRTHSLSLESKEHRALEGAGAFARFSESGHLVYPKGGSMRVVSFDPVRSTATGREASLGFPIALRPEEWHENPPFVDWSREGTLMYLPPDGFAQPRKSIVWVTRDGRKDEITQLVSRAPPDPRLSPDGRRLAFHSELWELWVHELENERPPLRLTFEGDNRQAVWSPDGERLAFVRGGADVLDIMTIATDGSETQPQVLATFARSRVGWIFPYFWTADGKDILCSDGTSVWRVLIDGSAEPTRLFDTPFDTSYPSVSPDGNWIAYSSNRTGGLEVFVSPYPDVVSRPPVRVSREQGVEPRWSRDGAELYFLEGNRLMAARIERGDDGVRASAPTALFEIDSVSAQLAYARYDVAPNGRFLVVEEPAPNQRSRAVVVENWFAELERLAPREN